ncbi:MAG: Spy/CpxP family protein refolding chaperone [bacterium]
MMGNWKKFCLYSLLCAVILVGTTFIVATEACNGQGQWGPYSSQCEHGPGVGPGAIHGPGRGFGPGAGANPGWQHLDRQRGLNLPHPYLEMLLNNEELKLTEKQKEAIKKLQVSYQKSTFEPRCDLQIKKLELKKLRYGLKPNYEKITSKQAEISELQLKIQNARTKLGLDADEVLTADQKDILYIGPLVRMPRPGWGRGQGYSRSSNFGPGQGLGRGQGPEGFYSVDEAEGN